MEKILKEKKIKITPARIAILNILNNSKIPINAESLYKKLNQNNKNINEATVYRTLLLFKDIEIIKSIDLRKESAYFEMKNEHHHHIACIKCDAVEDFENNKIEKTIKQIINNSSTFNNIQDHSLELFGICKKCS